MNLQQYFPVLLFIVVATLIGFALLTAGSLLGPRRPYAEKLSPYECGFEAVSYTQLASATTRSAVLAMPVTAASSA